MSAQVVEGRNLMIFFGTTTKKVCALAKSCKLTLNHATKERSSKDSGIWTELSKGRLKWGASTDGLHTIDASTQGYEYLFDAMIARNKVTITVAIASGTSPDWTVDTSETNYTGEAYITSLELNGNDGDDAGYTVSLDGDGALAKVAGV